MTRPPPLRTGEERLVADACARSRTERIRDLAHEAWESELLVWNEAYYRERYLAGGPFPDSWTRLPPLPTCPACGRGYLVDPGGADAGKRCMVEIDAGPDRLVLEAGCGYRAGTGPTLD
ncbi:MAG: hypothetical protein OXE86_11305 [Alphaproteobacteria bacterium]|nr:hypothetical protein [Alphaproteobacteria bacterium]